MSNVICNNVQVDPWLSVSAAHAIGEAVRHQLRKTYQNLTETYVHIGTEMLSTLGHSPFRDCHTKF